MDKVLDNLYIGSLEQANDAELLEQHEVQYIISLGCQVNESILHSTRVTALGTNKQLSSNLINVSFLDTLDVTNYIIFREVRICCHIIAYNLQHNINTLVHCVYGQSRSVAIIAAYLIYKRVGSWALDAFSLVDDVLRDIKRVHRDIAINPGFICQLLMIAKYPSLNSKELALLEHGKVPSRVLLRERFEESVEYKFTNSLLFDSIKDCDLNRRSFELNSSLHDFDSNTLGVSTQTAPAALYRILCKRCKATLAYDPSDVVCRDNFDYKANTRILSNSYWEDFTPSKLSKMIQTSSLPIHGIVVLSLTAPVVKSFYMNGASILKIEEDILCHSCGSVCGYWIRDGLEWCQGYFNSYLFCLRLDSVLKRRL